MFRILLIFIVHYLVESVRIEYPTNKYIEERIRQDLNSIDPIYRYYIIPRELQFHTNAVKDSLPYFLQCKGSKKSIKFTVPTSATEHLSLDTDRETNTITAKLRKDQLTSDLVGRYTCSELVDDKIQETSIHVFIQDGQSVFTKKLYPKVFKQTGIHFFNLPCQTTSWYPRMSCSITSNSKQCKLGQCNSQERQENEQDLCIPVYYTPPNLKPEKVFFDPQIGFALENPTILDGLNQFSCMSNYTPNQESRIPFESKNPEYLQIQIHQPSLTVMSDETVRLSCGIQYGIKINRTLPVVFWFEDIYNFQLISNETEKPVFNLQTKVYDRNTSITLRGFKSGENYRFYCVRASDQGLYSRSIDINCTKTPSLTLEINLSGTDNKIQYGSNGIYDITIFTVPRSSIILDIFRNDISLLDDKRFEITSINNQENQFIEYILTIHNITFEDEMDLKIKAKSSVLEKTKTIKPKIIGNPVGELSFIPQQIPFSIPWRNENSKNKLNIYPYGIFKNELYRIVCTIRHRSDLKQSLNVFIQYYQCSIDNCLSNLFDQTCRTPSNQNSISTTTSRINDYQTQFVSIDSYKLDNPDIGYQYLCCYKENGLITIAKAITILSHNRNMFNINKPDFSLVKGNVLTYRCESHNLVYDNLQMIYNDGLFTYERNRLDNNWHLKGTQQVKQIDIDWDLPISKNIRSKVVEVQTPPLKSIGNNGYFQCIALSKREDIIPNVNDTYVINVDGSEPLQFKNKLPTVSRVDRKSDDNVEFDCKYDGQPKPKLVWYKGKILLNTNDPAFKFKNSKASFSIPRVRASDTGYYTCELSNGRDAPLRRSFDLRVKGNNPYSRFGRLTAIFIFISILLLLLMLIMLVIFAIKYFKMKRNVHGSVFHGNKGVGTVDKTQTALSQLTRIPLPENFASQHQIRTFLDYLDDELSPVVKDDFKELGRGQFGVVYQVRLPDVGLVAAKALPESIRNKKHRRDKHKKSNDGEENQEMISKHELRKKKAAEMLIDEIKVMHKAGKHVNIVGLKKVAYPETKVRFLFTGGPIQDEDSFYLMELCSNGSLESMLKRFIQPSPSLQGKSSLYETLSKQTESEMTVEQAYEQCRLTDDDLKLIAYQVACGVDYLNRRQIAHCDIASRNVLVTSRFIMKICDFGLATWTTYKNYREQLAQNESVQLEKKNNEIATHNLTPELARDFLRASTPDERLLLNKSSFKSDVWSFGIFLWTLFLKCRIRPFDKLSQEMGNRLDGEGFFHRLARAISEGRVLRYIDYQPEIPRNIYAIIRECLAEENNRPEMTRIRAYLCHSKMLSKQAFHYYRSEYNRYQEENATDGNIELLAEVPGICNLPSFDGENATDEKSRRHDNVTFRPTTNDDTYYPEQEPYLPPGNKNSAKTTTESNPPHLYAKRRPPPQPPKKPTDEDDSYL